MGHFKKPRIFGLISDRIGSNHWWNQRLSSVALIPLTLLFVYKFAAVMDATHQEVLEIYQHPFNSIVLVLFLVVTAVHLRQGLEVVIEDYIHTEFTRKSLLLTSKLFCWFLIICSVFASAKIAFNI
jgi:succinate dehydrogenase / fumarate reductase membrane anchor subunit